MMRTFTFASGCLAVAFTLLCASRASASSIQYTFSGFATGTVGSNNFSDSAFRIDLEADTASFTQFEGSPVTGHSPATISISGVGNGVFQIFPQVFVNHGTSVAGLTDIGGFDDLIDLTSPAFATYDLHDLIGPINTNLASPFSASFGAVPLDIGTLAFTSARNITFTASAVPEPAGLILFGLAPIALLCRLRRSQRARYSKPCPLSQAQKLRNN